MKEFILIAGLLLACVGFSQANIKKGYKVEEPAKVQTVKDVLEANRTTPYIISFFDVDKIVIKNDKKALIRIYDADWKLIKTTDGDVNLNVVPGNYYVACEKRLKAKYVNRG